MRHILDYDRYRRHFGGVGHSVMSHPYHPLQVDPRLHEDRPAPQELERSIFH